MFTMDEYPLQGLASYDIYDFSIHYGLPPGILTEYPNGLKPGEADAEGFTHFIIQELLTVRVNVKGVDPTISIEDMVIQCIPSAEKLYINTLICEDEYYDMI